MKATMYLGFDLGTSGLRGLLIDDDANVVADAQVGYKTQHPQSGWSEQDPSCWTNACDEVIEKLRKTHAKAVTSIRGIGVSGHMHGATLLDGKGKPLRPCILWNDTRSADQAAQLDSIPEMRQITGNIVFPGFTAPKLAWVRDHEPKIFENTDKVLLPKDYLGLWLTGEYVSDMSDSSGTSWLDVGARDWSDKALALGHMRKDQMPQLIEGSQKAGELRKSLCEAWGIDGPVSVAGGAADNAAAACGVGCFAEGTGFVSLGTSGVLLAAKDSFRPAPDSAVHSFCHAIPDRWYQMGVILAATDCLNWYASTVGQTAKQLSGQLPATINGPASVIFLPYLSGERTPHNDAEIRGAFIGLDVATTSETMTQAIMEGVAFALRDNLEALKSTGTNLHSLLAIGGGTASPFWLETLATVLQLPLEIPKGGEFGAAMGAARLALCAATGADPETVMTKPDIAHTIMPRDDLMAQYQASYERYTQLYPLMKSLKV